MKILWNGTDITGYVAVRKCVVRDTCGERCDGLDIEFENADSWYKWSPEKDDIIRITHDGWDSGALYLNTIAPTDGKYRVIATALPCKARKKEWRCFEGEHIEQILQKCGAATGMEWRTFGVNQEIKIPYIQQENEMAAAFLNRLSTLEGAVLKCVNGRYTMIDLEWAQNRPPQETIRIIPEQEGTDYRRGSDVWSSVTLTTPYASGSAIDSSVDSKNPRHDITGYPAMDNVQAARWARNLLKSKNRKSEMLVIRSTFNATWSAMYRIDITGGTDADGQWLIEEVEHDLKDENSVATLRRCIISVS